MFQPCMAQDKIPAQMTTMLYDYFHVGTVSLMYSYKVVQKCGVPPAIIVCLIKSCSLPTVHSWEQG